jgi:hypothetical protein
MPQEKRIVTVSQVGDSGPRNPFLNRPFSIIAIVELCVSGKPPHLRLLQYE